MTPYSAQVGATKAAVGTTRGQVTGWQIVNTTAALAYVQVYDKASADVTVGTTVADYIIPIPPSGGAVAILDRNKYIPHLTACTVACTTTRTGNTGAACDLMLWYEDFFHAGS